MAVKDFVLKDGLKVQSNVVIGTYTYSANPIPNGMIVSGGVGIGTSVLTTGSKLEVQGGNLKVGSNGYGLVFPDGTYQDTAAVSGEANAIGGSGAVQYADGTLLGGDNTKFYYDSGNVRLGLGTTATSSATLNIKGTAPALFNTDSGSDKQIIVGNSTSYGSTLSWTESTNVGFLNVAGGTTALQWDNLGNLGTKGITPVNSLDVGGGVVIGGGIAYAGTATAPVNGLLVQGSVGLGTTTVGTIKLVVDGGPSVFSGNVGIGTSNTTGIVAGNVAAVFGSTHVLGSVYVDSNVTSNTFTMSQTVDYTSIYTSSTTSQQDVDSFSALAYRAAEYQISIEGNSTYQITRITLIHNGSTAYVSEYDSVSTSDVLASFDADISSNNARLLATPVNAATTFKISRKLWKI